MTLLLLAESGFGQTLEATFYVSPTGSDSPNGRTPGTAFRTIGKAVAVAQAGNLEWIRGGTYHEYVPQMNSGSPNARITFEPYPG
jgi:hypothetical protein